MRTVLEELLEAGVPFTVTDEWETKELIRHMVNRAERKAEAKVRRGLMSWDAFIALPAVLEKKLRAEFGVIPGYNPDTPFNTYEDERTCLDEGMMPEPEFEPTAAKHWPAFNWKRLVNIACGQKAEQWRHTLDGAWELLRVYATLKHPMRNSTGQVVGQWTVIPNYSLWFGWFRGHLHVVYHHGGKVYRAEISYDRKTKVCTVLRDEENDKLPRFDPALARLA